jgi:hypothetical protein
MALVYTFHMTTTRIEATGAIVRQPARTMKKPVVFAGFSFPVFVAMIAQ